MQNGDLSNLRRASAGFAAGITEALVVVTPFEVVKIKLQQQKGTSKDLLKYRVGFYTLAADYEDMQGLLKRCLGSTAVL